MNILVVWMLTGLWHGAAWNFVIWGLLFALVLMAEKWLPCLQKLPALLRHGYVMLIVVISFVIFNAQDLTQAWTDLGGMFGACPTLVTSESLYYLRSYTPLFLIGFVGATPLPRKLGERLAATSWGTVLEALGMITLLLVCTGYLVDGSFSPFLYFRF